MSEPSLARPETAEVESTLLAERLVAIIRLSDHRAVVEIAQTLAASGIRMLEVTLEHPDGLRSVERVASAVGDSVIVGAGTVIRPALVPAARDAGARFCVCPHLDPAIIAAAQQAGVLPIPGAFTPTEIVQALGCGAPFIKLFPAGAAGLGYLRALRGPLPQARIIPTGGVTIDDVGAWLRAGAAAVALGSDLVDRTGSLDGLAARARRAVEVVAGRPGPGEPPVPG